MKVRGKYLSIFLVFMLMIAGVVGCSNAPTKDNVAVGKGVDQSDMLKPEKGPKITDGNQGIAAGDVVPSLVDLGNGKFKYVLKNQSEQEKNFEFTSSQRYDFAVINEKGEQVYLFSSVALFMTVLGVETLMPGEELTYEIDVAELGLEKGKYTLEVWFTTKGIEDFRASIEFTVN